MVAAEKMIDHMIDTVVDRLIGGLTSRRE